MKRRHFIRLIGAGSLGAAGFGLSGCEEYYDTPRYGRYDYDYYVDSNVYYHAWTGSYFYYVDGVWIRSGTLPFYIILRPSYRRRIVITDRVPYARNREHRRSFPRPTRQPSRGDRIVRDRDGRDRQRDRINRDEQRRQDQMRDRARRDREAQQRRLDQQRERTRIEQEQRQRLDQQRERARRDRDAQQRLEQQRQRTQIEREQRQRQEEQRQRVRIEQEQRQRQEDLRRRAREELEEQQRKARKRWPEDER